MEPALALVAVLVCVLLAAAISRRIQGTIVTLPATPPMQQIHERMPAVLAEDMVISIDIPMFNTAWGGLRVEDGFLVTSDGAERLSTAPSLIAV